MYDPTHGDVEGYVVCVCLLCDKAELEEMKLSYMSSRREKCSSRCISTTIAVDSCISDPPSQVGIGVAWKVKSQIDGTQPVHARLHVLLRVFAWLARDFSEQPIYGVEGMTYGNFTKGPANI